MLLAPASKLGGFSLIESLIALLIISVGLVGNAALQSTLSKQSANADNRVRATTLAEDIHSRMVSDYTNIGCYAYPTTGTCGNAVATEIAQWKTAWAAQVTSLPGAIAPSVTVTGNACPCRITIRWKPSQNSTTYSYSVPFKIDTTL